MINDKSSGSNSGSGGAYFSVRFRISHRSIKIGVIFIAVLIFAVIAIPAGSEITPRKSGELKAATGDPQIFISPDMKLIPGPSEYLGISEVININFNVFEGNTIVWAMTRVISHGEPDPPADFQVFYIASPRIQALFELSLATGAHMEIYGNKIKNPEGINLSDNTLIYEAESARIFPG